MIQVYAILERAPRRKPPRGASGEPLRFVKVGPLVVAAGSLDAGPALSRAELEKRDRFVRELAGAVDAILPARWGSLLRDDVALGEEVSLRSQALVAALANVRGREQMTLRLLAATPRPAPASRESGTAYLEARARELADARTAPELDPLRPELSKLVRDERVERSPGASLVSVHHLIERGRAAEYRAAIATAKLEVALRTSGPSPPYAFAPELVA